MTVYIDADACPVTRIAERVAKEYGVPVVLLCDICLLQIIFKLLRCFNCCHLNLSLQVSCFYLIAALLAKMLVDADIRPYGLSCLTGRDRLVKAVFGRGGVCVL